MSLALHPAPEFGRTRVGRWFFEHDGPTILVALAIYGLWTALIWFNGDLPWWVIVPLGGYVIAWHFSLQHEAIHAFRGVPDWLRFAIVFPPLGLWFPYNLYRRSHSIHHRDQYLTDPALDTESYFVHNARWPQLSRFERCLLLFNQTLPGRLAVGPVLRLWKLITKESGRIRHGDFTHAPVWLIHAAALAVLFWFISHVCGMPWWQYCLLVAYPGLSLGLLRAFTEHRSADSPDERTASVESNVVFGLLFLYNNLHVAHHQQPTLAWYRLPAFYRQNRAALLTLNDGFVFRGYGEILIRYWRRPVFHPAHPVL